MIDPDLVKSQITLSVAQTEQIEKDIAKKLKKERTFEGGVKQIREKTPFHF